MRVCIAIVLIGLSPFCGFAQQKTSEYLQKKPDEFIDINWQPAVLAPGFRPRKTYRFTTETDLLLSTYDSPDRQILIQQQMRFDTEDRPSKTAGVSVRAMTERLRFTINSGEQSLQYDSLKKPVTKLDQHFHSTIRRYVRMEVNDEMQLLSQRVAGKLGKQDQPLEGLPTIGPDELIQVIRLIPQGFSKNPVSIGESWNQAGKRQIGELGELDFNVTYTLAGFIKHHKVTCAVIEFYGQMSGDITAEDQNHINFQSAQLLGRILFDPTLRVVQNSESTVTMTVNMPNPDNPAETKPVSVRQNTVLNFLSVK